MGEKKMAVLLILFYSLDISRYCSSDVSYDFSKSYYTTNQ